MGRSSQKLSVSMGRGCSREVAWINSNVITSFLIVLLPISMVGLESYRFPIFNTNKTAGLHSCFGDF